MARGERAVTPNAASAEQSNAAPTKVLRVSSFILGSER
ncbi:hypothetical protein ACPOL_4889 [Acidisarcina polymorpha]|uniref:Uncharacterized protein n=1 Tax=Acidisarcina polymorpha TaxID=2211140 RepID=A0A2Z5G502_9BACT|nr:hypothetical protein ACPOL_4889 [Acidisarcina polymorpha]